MISKIRKEILTTHLQYLWDRSPYYRNIFESCKLDRQRLNDTDLNELPFTTKEQLQQRREDFICVPKNRFIDHVTTSGTTGKALTLSLTEKDLERLAENECGSFKFAGITADDTIQLMTTIDRRFMAGLAYFLGARKLGAGIIRVGNGIPELQWDTISEMRPTAIICVPSFLLKLIEYAEKNAIDFKRSSVKKAVCIGEAIREENLMPNALAKKISEKWDIELYSTYASSEMATAFTECEHFCGAHVQDHLIVAEIINENGEAVKPGQPGELVVTPLGIEGMPVLRFKTGDICIGYDAPCRCGREGLRIGPIFARKNQLIKYKGTTLYPASIYEILNSIQEIENYQVEISSGEAGTDEISINLGTRSDEKTIHSKISDTFKAKLRVTPRLQFMTPEAVGQKLTSEGGRKPKVFVDKRRTKQT